MRDRIRKNIVWVVIATLLLAFVPSSIILAEGKHTLIIGDSNIDLKINGATFTQGMNIKDNDPVKLSIHWSLSNGDNISVGDKCTYDLKVSGLTLAAKSNGSVKNGSNVVGSYEITPEGKLTIVFTDETYAALSNREGDLSLDGVVDLDNITLDDSGDGVVKIADKEFGIHVLDENRPQQVSVSKSVGTLSYDAAKGMMKRTYTIKVTALTDTTNISVKDTAGNKILIDSSTITSTGNKFVKNSDTVASVSPYLSGFAGTIGTMAKGDVVDITYLAYADPTIYGITDQWNSADNNNSVSTTDKFNHVQNSNVRFTVNSPSGNKTGNYSNGVFTWKITIDNQDGIDLKGGVLKDIFTDAAKCETIGTTEMVKINGTTSSLSVNELLSSGYIFPTGSTKKSYTFEYSTTVKSEYSSSISDQNIENRFTFEDTTYNISIDNSVNGTIPGQNPLTKKQGSWSATVENQIDWTSNMTVATGGATNLVYTDEYVNQEIVSNSVVVKKGTQIVDSTKYTFSQETTTKFTITFATIEAGDYTILYSTKATAQAIQNNQKDFYNKAYISINGSTPGAVKDYTVKKISYIEKRAYQSQSSINSDTATWVVALTKEGINAMTNASQYSVVDTLPVGTEYVTGSAKVYLSNEWDINRSAFSTNVSAVVNNHQVTFQLNNVITAAKAATNWYDINLYIQYQTKITDSQAFLNSGTTGITLTNAAEVKEDTKVLDKDSATVTAKPKSILSKDAKYDTDTAPDADYTIKVNEDGYDLLENGDTLTIKDTLPTDNFVFKENSLKVYVGNTTTQLDSSKWTSSYERASKVITIHVPDETFVTIKYSVTIEMAVGANLTDQNSKNKVEISGISIQNNSTNKVLSGTVLQGSATAVSNSRSITIKKFSSADNKLLPNAGFQVKMVTYSNGQYTDVAAGAISGYSGAVSFKTKSDGTYTVDNLLYDHLYAIVEKEAPAGYKLDSTPIYFVFLKETAQNAYPTGTNFYTGERKTVEIANDEATILKISKKAVGATSELAGATLSLYKDSVTGANKVFQWTSGTGEKEFTVVSGNPDYAKGEIAPGTYIMKEDTAPKGYELAENITFFVAADGKVTSHTNGEISGDQRTITMRDKAKAVDTTQQTTTTEKTDTTTDVEKTTTTTSTATTTAKAKKKTSTKTKKSEAPETGDHTYWMEFLILAIVSGMGIICISCQNRKKNKKK